MYQTCSIRVVQNQREKEGYPDLDSRYKILDSGFFVRGTWIRIPTVSGIADSLICIPDSKRHHPDNLWGGGGVLPYEKLKGIAAGWGRIFTTGLIIMGSHILWFLE